MNNYLLANTELKLRYFVYLHTVPRYTAQTAGFYSLGSHNQPGTHSPDSLLARPTSCPHTKPSYPGFTTNPAHTSCTHSPDSLLARPTSCPHTKPSYPGPQSTGPKISIHTRPSQTTHYRPKISVHTSDPTTHAHNSRPHPT